MTHVPVDHDGRVDAARLDRVRDQALLAVLALDQDPVRAGGLDRLVDGAAAALAGRARAGARCGRMGAAVMSFEYTTSVIHHGLLGKNRDEIDRAAQVRERGKRPVVTTAQQGHQSAAEQRADRPARVREAGRVPAEVSQQPAADERRDATLWAARSAAAAGAVPVGVMLAAHRDAVAREIGVRKAVFGFVRRGIRGELDDVVELGVAQDATGRLRHGQAHEGQRATPARGERLREQRRLGHPVELAQRRRQGDPPEPAPQLRLSRAMTFKSAVAGQSDFSHRARVRRTAV